MVFRPILASRGEVPSRAALVLIALSLLLTGCYTMLRHPAAVEETAVRSDADCVRCHYEDDYYASPSYSPWVEYYASSSWPWINYYGSPWWYGETWVPYRGGSGSDAGEDGQKLPGRQGWVLRPRGSGIGPDSTRFRDPLVVPAPIISAPSIPGPSVGNPQGNPGSTTPDPQEEKEKEKPRKRSIRR